MAKKLQWHPVQGKQKEKLIRFLNISIKNLVHTKREEEFCDRLSSRATFNGFTALHYAVLNDNLSMINLLIEHGADPLIENEQGHLPSAYALQRTKELLSEFEKNVSLAKYES